MVTTITGDAGVVLQSLKSESVNCIVTSPPYYGLRDYGVEGQIGLEDSVDEYISRLVSVFRECMRVLRADGTMWLNISDSYAGSRKGAANYPESAKGKKQETSKGLLGAKALKTAMPDGCKPKDMIGVPWMLALALRNDGWFLRQDIIWSKPNPMPESVTDRCTKSHEYLFLLSKSRKYHFDAEAISEPVVESTVKRLGQDIENQSGGARTLKTNGNMKACAPRYGGKKYTESPDVFYRTKSGHAYDCTGRRNKRDVWTISTKPFNGEHFATFPPELVEPCVLAGCPMGGTVLDPFFGSGTTGVVASALGRDCIGIELNPRYAKMAARRNSQITIYDALKSTATEDESVGL